MAASALALLDQTLPLGSGSGSDKLNKEIFSILESNFLFGAQTPELGAGYVRVLSIDGGVDGGSLAVAVLVWLEQQLQELSGNPAAGVVDYFDLAAGSGAGGFLVAALFARRMTTEQARDVVAKNRKVFAGRAGHGGLFSSRPEAVFKKVFGDLTVRDAAKPLLIPCYDMATAVLESRRGAVVGMVGPAASGRGGTLPRRPAATDGGGMAHQG
ncbi:hypothetical protein ACQ4PT_039728 [Festuca glaucescens]